MKGANQSANYRDFWKLLSILKEKIGFSSSFAALFCPNHIKVQLKGTGKLSLMTLKSDTKFKEKLTCGFKCDMRNSVKFHPTTQKSKNITLMGSFFPNYTKFELKTYRGVTFHDTKQWFKIWINPDLVVSKMKWGIG